MATFESIAKEYADFLKQNFSDKAIYDKLKNKLENLNVTKFGKTEKISPAEILEILNLIETELSARKISEKGIIVEAESSVEFIKLVKVMQSEYKKEK